MTIKSTVEGKIDQNSDAEKKPAARVVPDLLKLINELPTNTQLNSLLSLILPASLLPSKEIDTEGEELACDPAVAPIGLTRPATRTVVRTFGFMDLAGFTAGLEEFGAEHTIVMLSVFRSLVREVAAARGCRVEKFIGDGVMIVGTDEAPLISTVMEISKRLSDADVQVCSGVATGEVLLYEGDDYIGRAANLAARLSDNARPGQVLVDESIVEHLPEWIKINRTSMVKLKGLGRVQVHSLVVKM